MAVISLRAAPGLDSLRTRTDHLERLQVHLADKTPVTKSNLASLPPRELDRVRTSLATRDRSEYYLGNGKDDPIQATTEADDLFVHGPVRSPLLGEEIHQRQRRRVEQGWTATGIYPLLRQRGWLDPVSASRRLSWD